MGFPSYRRDIASKEVIRHGTAKFDREFGDGAVRIVRETGKPIAKHGALHRFTHAQLPGRRCS
ncbi:MAG: hypothetical protein JWR32_5978 [Mycobacterium sp.]|jgi:hypothetical protein|nr:hypothetical protein [Mycobacterium sp.]